MNAGNLMAVSTADGTSAGTGVQGARNVSAASRTQTASGKNTFSDTMGALQKKGMTADATKIQTNNGSADVVQGKPAATQNNGSAQDAQDVKKAASDSTEKGKTDALKEISAEDKDADTSAAAAVLASLLQVDVNAALVNHTGAEEELPAALSDILKRYGLTADQLSDDKLQTTVQNLLQQMPEAGEKSKNFLLALSGEPLALESTDSAPVQTAPAAALARLVALDAAMPAQLRAALQDQMTSVSEPVPSVSSEQTTQNVQPSAVPAVQMTAAAQQTLVQGQGKRAADLVGENLTTKTVAEPVSPLDVLAQRTMRHDAMQQNMAEDAQQEQHPMQSEAQTDALRGGVPFETAVRAAEAPAVQSTPEQAMSMQAPAQQPVQDVQAPPAPETPQRPQTDYEIPRQIVEQARLLRTMTDTQMVIRLKPEHLGELTLRVAVGADGAVQASFHSDNAHVRSVIENSLVQLRQELNTQGIKVDRVGVYTGLADGQMPQGQGQEAWQQQSSRGEVHSYANGDADDYLDVDAAEGTAPSTTQESRENVAAEGVDYRV